MNSGLFQLLRPCALGCLLAAGAWAGPEARAAQPINLDTALAEEALAQAGADGAPADGAPADLALSYYHYVLAQWYDNNGDPRRALDAMKQALGHNPQSSAVHLETALLLGKTGNLGEAIAYAEKAARLDPENPEPRWLLANIYLRPSERSPGGREWLLKAAAELEALKLLTPGDERVHYLLGSLYFQLNEPEKAIAAYEQYQRLPGIGGLGYRAIAKHYEETGEPEKALEYLNRALEAEPESPEALMQLGSLYSRIGENRKAAEAFQALLELTGHNPEVTRSLAESLFNDGDYAETIRLLEDLGEKTPLDRESRLLLGRPCRRHPDLQGPPRRGPRGYGSALLPRSRPGRDRQLRGSRAAFFRPGPRFGGERTGIGQPHPLPAEPGRPLHRARGARQGDRALP